MKKWVLIYETCECEIEAPDIHRFSRIGRLSMGPPGFRVSQVLNSSVKLMKWDHPLVDASAPSPDVARSIIDRWNPFNKRDASVADMHEFYPLVSEYWWWLSLKNIPSPSPNTWIKSPTNVWSRTGCIFATMTSMRRLSWYDQTSNCLIVSLMRLFSSIAFIFTGCHYYPKHGTPA